MTGVENVGVFKREKVWLENIFEPNTAYTNDLVLQSNNTKLTFF